jgi:hypothetical protein
MNYATFCRRLFDLCDEAVELRLINWLDMENVIHQVSARDSQLRSDHDDWVENYDDVFDPWRSLRSLEWPNKDLTNTWYRHENGFKWRLTTNHESNTLVNRYTLEVRPDNGNPFEVMMSADAFIKALIKGLVACSG